MYISTEPIAPAERPPGSRRRLVRRAGAPVMALGAVLATGLLPAGNGGPIPLRPAVAVAQEGSVRETDGKAWLGIGLDNMAECRAGQVRGREECRRFTVISTVVVGGPAEEAGVVAGDTLIALGDAAPGTDAYRAQLSNLRVGETVRLVVGSSGGRVSLNIVPRSWPQPTAMRVRAGPNVTAWVTPGVELEIPPVVDDPDSAGPTVFAFGGSDGRRIVIMPGDDKIHVRVLEIDPETGEHEVRSLEVELKQLARQLERYVDRQQLNEVLRDRVRKLDYGPALAAIRDSVLRAARVTLDSVVRTGRAYKVAPNVYVPVVPTLAERTPRVAGAEFEPLGPDLAYEGEETGLLVLRVLPGTPAYEVGLRRGDVVMSVGGETCNTVSDFREMLVGHRDRPLEVTWKRRGQILTGVIRR